MKLLDLRLAYRFQRFEIVGFGVLIALASIAAALIASRLDATGYGAHCSPGGTQQPPTCEAMGRAFSDIQSAQVSPVAAILLVLPFLLAAVIGAALVGREIERGTSRLAWSLAPSRAHWLLVRVLPVLAIVFGLSFIAGAALDRLTAATQPWTDISNSFAAYGTRGVILAGRVTFVFAIGVAVGAVLGRVMPALIVTAVVAYFAIAGGIYVHNRILVSEAVLIDATMNDQVNLFIDQRVRLPDGRLLTWEELTTQFPPPGSTNGPVATDVSVWPPPGFTPVDLVIPGTRYRFVEMREVGALAGGSIVALGVAALAVRRRRPG